MWVINACSSLWVYSNKYFYLISLESIYHTPMAIRRKRKTCMEGINMRVKRHCVPWLIPVQEQHYTITGGQTGKDRYLSLQVCQCSTCFFVCFAQFGCSATPLWSSGKESVSSCTCSLLPLSCWTKPDLLRDFSSSSFAPLACACKKDCTSCRDQKHVLTPIGQSR